MTQLRVGAAGLTTVPQWGLLTRSGTWGVLAATMLLLAAPAGAQSSIAHQPREFGVEDVAILNIGPCGLQAIGGATISRPFNQDCSSLSPVDSNFLLLGADVRLPAGALITEVTIDYYDAVPANPGFVLQRVSSTGAATFLFNVTPDFSGGNNRITIPIDPPETVDNQTYNYALFLVLQTTSQKFFRAAIKYRRQVSPAPAVATFGDVPLGHPQRQYVEALVSAGITAGCGNGNYCPDASLTRGQMAVFLSKALGLHFAP